MNLKKVVQAFRLLADALEEGLDVETVAEEVIEEEPKKKTKKKVAKKTTKAAAKKAKSKVKAKEVEEDEEENKKLSEADVRNAVKAYAKANSRDAAFKLLAEFDANKVADLRPNQYCEVMERLS